MKPKIHNDIVVVDEHDNVIGAAVMQDAIAQGMIRRASRVYVLNNSGELLIQRRSKNVLKPLLLDVSAAGHVDKGETYLETAKRELFEELGLSGFALTEIVLSLRIENFFNGMYKLVIPDNTPIHFDVEEVEEVIWMKIKDVDTQVTESPEKFTPAFLAAWPLLREKIIS